MGCKRFEDLEIWKTAQIIISDIYNLICSNVKFQKDFGFKDQLQRAVISIANNIAEGFERRTNKEFINFLYYAKGSAGEVRSMLYTAKKINYISESEFNIFTDRIIELSKHISNFIKYLRRS